MSAALRHGLRNRFVESRIFATRRAVRHLFGMAKAIWENAVIAESNQTVEVEGNQYFPADSIKSEYFKPSPKHSECPWKGTASYYNVEVNGKTNADAAWFYPNPKPEAQQIQNHVAFWKGVKVQN